MRYLRQAGLQARRALGAPGSPGLLRAGAGRPRRVCRRASPRWSRRFEIRLELRPVLSLLGEIRRALERLREAETLAEQLNDDRRRGRVSAFMTIAHSHLGELDEALVTGTRALEIAGRLGDSETSHPRHDHLEQAHYYRGDYERVVELATDNLAALPADSGLRVTSAPPTGIDLQSLLAGQEPRRARPIRRGGPVRGRGAPARRADASRVHRRYGALHRGHASPPQG